MQAVIIHFNQGDKAKLRLKAIKARIASIERETYGIYINQAFLIKEGREPLNYEDSSSADLEDADSIEISYDFDSTN